MNGLRHFVTPHIKYGTRISQEGASIEISRRKYAVHVRNPPQAVHLTGSPRFYPELYPTLVCSVIESALSFPFSFYFAIIYQFS